MKVNKYYRQHVGRVQARVSSLSLSLSLQVRRPILAIHNAQYALLGHVDSRPNGLTVAQEDRPIIRPASQQLCGEAKLVILPTRR